MVNTRPQVAWAWDLAERNLEFLRGIDVGYFEHVARTEGPILESDRSQYAAAAIRVVYGQALETFFALVAAAAQAPSCVVGWMLSYRNDELQSVITDLPSTSLPALAASTMSATAYDDEKRIVACQRDGTAGFLPRLSSCTSSRF